MSHAEPLATGVVDLYVDVLRGRSLMCAHQGSQPPPRDVFPRRFIETAASSERTLQNDTARLQHRLHHINSLSRLPVYLHSESGKFIHQLNYHINVLVIVAVKFCTSFSTSDKHDHNTSVCAISNASKWSYVMRINKSRGICNGICCIIANSVIQKTKRILWFV